VKVSQLSTGVVFTPLAPFLRHWRHSVADAGIRNHDTASPFHAPSFHAPTQLAAIGDHSISVKSLFPCIFIFVNLYFRESFYALGDWRGHLFMFKDFHFLQMSVC
jgi:hypothetical protein